jgi:phospholipid N-methyltransferase
MLAADLTVGDRVVAALGDRTYPFGLELAAGDGALTERLAPRCGRLITLEPSVEAVGAARRRLERLGNVDARVGRAPEDLPGWTFDLVVCCGVFAGLPRRDQVALLEGLEERMPRASTLLAVSRGDARAHAALRSRPALVRVHGERHGGVVLDRFERR